MDRIAVETAVREWLDELARNEAAFARLEGAHPTANPAFLVDAKTPEGDAYKAGAVPIVVTADRLPDTTILQKLRDAVLSDGTLSNRVKRAASEFPRLEGEVGTIVVLPRFNLRPPCRSMEAHSRAAHVSLR